MKRTPLKRGKRLQPRSKKQATLYRKERRPLVAQLLAEFPVCQRCQSRRSVDVHELRTRGRGGSITDPENLAVLCRECHEVITQNPKQATEEGWMRNSWAA